MVYDNDMDFIDVGQLRRELQREIASVESSLTTLRHDFNELTDRVGGQDLQVAAAGEQLEDHDSRLRELAAQLTRLETFVNALRRHSRASHRALDLTGDGKQLEAARKVAEGL